MLTFQTECIKIKIQKGNTVRRLASLSYKNNRTFRLGAVIFYVFIFQYLIYHKKAEQQNYVLHRHHLLCIAQEVLTASGYPLYLPLFRGKIIIAYFYRLSKYLAAP